MKSSAAPAALSAAVLAAALPAYAAQRDALWAVVQVCLLDSRVTGSPWPCLSVDQREGVAVVGDPKRRTQVW